MQYIPIHKFSSLDENCFNKIYIMVPSKQIDRLYAPMSLPIFLDFNVKKFGLFKVKGSFGAVRGKVDFRVDDLNHSFFDICVSVLSLDTKNKKRDSHLFEKEFFDIMNFQFIGFKSMKIQKSIDGYIVLGVLSIKHKSEEIKIRFDEHDGLLTGKFKINRYNYNLGAKIPNLFIGKNVTISLQVFL